MITSVAIVTIVIPSTKLKQLINTSLMYLTFKMKRKFHLNECIHQSPTSGHILNVLVNFLINFTRPRSMLCAENA